MYCQRYNNLISELHSLISKSDAHFATIRVYDKIIYLLNLGNDNTWKLVGKFNYSFYVQKRKEIINTNVIKLFRHLAFIVSLYWLMLSYIVTRPIPPFGD